MEGQSRWTNVCHNCLVGTIYSWHVFLDNQCRIFIWTVKVNKWQLFFIIFWVGFHLCFWTINVEVFYGWTVHVKKWKLFFITFLVGLYLQVWYVNLFDHVIWNEHQASGLQKSLVNMANQADILNRADEQRDSGLRDHRPEQARGWELPCQSRAKEEGDWRLRLSPRSPSLPGS